MCNVDNDRQVYELQTSRPEANWDARVDYYVSELIGFFRHSRVGTVLLTSVFDPFVFFTSVMSLSSSLLLSQRLE